MSERERFIYQTAPILGFNTDEARKVLRRAQTLHTWAVHECNGTIQRDEDTGDCFWYNPDTGRKGWRTADRETGAQKWLLAMAEEFNLELEIQGDPRGWIVKFKKDGREYGVPSKG